MCNVVLHRVIDGEGRHLRYQKGVNDWVLIIELVQCCAVPDNCAVNGNDA
jgi:hypothetical protein